MRAVFKHELRACFTNMTAYIFAAFLLVFAGIYVLVYNLNYKVTNFEYVLQGMSFVFLIIVPILTMRILAEERRQKTDQLLYSLPLSMTQVVLGKYLALLCMFVLPLAVMCLYPLYLSAFGSVHFPAAYGAICGFFFLGAALIAIGTFISSVTESQAAAAGICFLVVLLNYFLSSISGMISGSALAAFIAMTVIVVLIGFIVRWMTKNTFTAVISALLLEAALLVYYTMSKDSFEELLTNLMTKLSLFEHFYVFVDGVFDLTAIVFFVSIIGLFLFLSVQSLEKRRWSE